MDDGAFAELYSSAAAGVNVDAAGSGGERFCQWSPNETQDFLVIRAELDQTFMETRRNKFLWDLISTRMKEIGHNRSPQQCKSKWKNLVSRYKGCATIESEAMRQETFPFYNHMQIIFNARIDRMLWLESGGAAPGAAPGAAAASTSQAVQTSSNDDDDGGEQGRRKRRKTADGGRGETSGSSIVDGLKEIMERFMRQQMEMEMARLKAFEESEERRRVREMEWRQKMEALENERLMMVNRWREREEQRKMREEARSERRDALVTALLNKLRREGVE